MRISVSIMCPILALAVGACGTGTGESPPVTRITTSLAVSTPSSVPTTDKAPCKPALPGVDLGANMRDSDPETRVQVVAGWYLVSATGFLHGGIFDPPVGLTSVAFGPADSAPIYERGPSVIRNATGSFLVSEEAGTWVQLPAGTYWFVNSYGAGLTIAGCAPALPSPAAHPPSHR